MDFLLGDVFGLVEGPSGSLYLDSVLEWVVSLSKTDDYQNFLFLEVATGRG
jgi:hypothetical protein